MATEKRLIYAEDLFEPVDFTVLQVRKGGPGGGKTMAMYERLFRKRVEMAPTVDAAPVVHAHWELAGNTGYLRCAHCKDVYINEAWLTDGRWSYCPNCGAKMDGGSHGTSNQ